MKSVQETAVTHDATIREVMELIDRTASHMAVVVDEDRRLLGVVTDGDIRRAVLRGMSTEEPAAEIMNTEPTLAYPGESPEGLIARMKLKRLHSVPVVDEQGRLLGVHIIDDLIGPPIHDNWVVLMAGGLGMRLRPLTSERPKPLLAVGEKPILETIVEHFVSNGFRRFFMSVNYKAEMVKRHFNDGAAWEVEIEYLHERERSGTAGALSLLPRHPEQPIIVMNGDLLTKVDFNRLLDFHTEHGVAATMCVKEYDFMIPYGVVGVEGHLITEIKEKPTHRLFVNAGIYVIEPRVLGHIPRETFYDMPLLFESLIERGEQTAAFPITEYWLDIGSPADYERANQEYQQVFDSTKARGDLR